MRINHGVIGTSLVVLASLASAACHETTTAPPSVAPFVAASRSLVAYTPRLQTGTPAAVVALAPAVVVRDQVGKPMSGIVVTFTVVDGGGFVSQLQDNSIDGGGFVSQIQAISNENGLASSGAWLLGPAGQNTLRATVAGAPAVAPLYFTAIGLVPPVDSSTYNLTTMGGSPLPVRQCCYNNWYDTPNSPVADTLTYSIIAGRYVFTSDSTFTARYLFAVADSTGVFHVDSTASRSDGTFIWVGPSTIHFYVGSIFIATGTPSGDVLGISPEECAPGYCSETYVRSRPPLSTRRSRDH